MKKLFRNYRLMIEEYIHSILGKSYFHPTPRLSKDFEPGKVGVYFYDFTSKTKWPYNYDNQGIPVFDGAQPYFAVTIILKALGHYNIYLEDHSSEDLDEFLNIAKWLHNQVDNRGGIKTWSNQIWHNGGRLYSAMTQGMAVSVFIRAYLITKKTFYLRSAKSCLYLLINDKRFGLKRKIKGGIALEEYPGMKFKTVLNGWIYAILGIYEYTLVRSDRQAQNFLASNLSCLANNLYRYDSGFWSYYDLNKHMASSFYHRSHIILLDALATCFPEYLQFEFYEKKFSRYLSRKYLVFYAQAIKIFQKIKEPTTTPKGF